MLLSLEDLLDDKYPDASFHDALLNHLTLDYLSRTAEFHMDLCVGDPDAHDEKEREAHAKGILRFDNFLFCVIEAPHPAYDFEVSGGLWIADDGPLLTSDNDGLSKLIARIPANAFVYYFFNNDWNTFIYIAAISAMYKWIE